MTPRRSKDELGRFGEQRAAAWYLERGFEVVEQNWFCPPEHGRGELDLVLRRASLVVICEVKTRTSARFGHGHEAVGHTKQRQIRRLASVWMHVVLREHDTDYVEIRFDVADVDADGSVTIYEQAF